MDQCKPLWMGVSLSVGGVKLADALNQVLTLTLLGLFALLMVGGAVRADWSAAGAYTRPLLSST